MKLARLFLIAFACISIECMVQAEVLELDYPMNRIPLCDSARALSIWIDSGYRLPLNDSESLPIRFNFSSHQQNYFESCMGDGWWMPLIESNVIEAEEGLLKVFTVGGSFVFLVKDKVESKTYSSVSGGWEGHLVNDSTFSLKGPSGWIFVYDKGLIKRISSPNGSKIDLVRHKNGEINCIKENKTVCKFKMAASGLLASIELEGEGKRLTFSGNKYPVYASADGSSYILGLKQSIDTLNLTHGLASLTRSSTNENEIKCDIKGIETDSPAFWDCNSGKLNRAAEWVYTEGKNALINAFGAEEISKDNEFVSLKRVNSKNNKYDFYAWSPQSSIEITSGSNDPFVKTYYIASAGAASGKIRSIERLSKEGKMLSSERYDYDIEGKVIRHIKENEEGVFIATNDWTQKICRLQLPDGTLYSTPLMHVLSVPSTVRHIPLINTK